MKDIYANVTGARGDWADYDMRYVQRRILRAIKEAKGTAVLALFMLPLAAHAQCVGPDRSQLDWVHESPCKPADIGYIEPPRRVHFKGNPTDAEVCDVMHALRASGYVQF
jgi:hypothetical protein